MKKIILLAILIAVATGALLVVRSCGPGGDGVVASFVAPRGETFLVVQKWQCWTEPYHVTCFVKNQDGRWRDYYVAHESNRLRDVVITPFADDAGVAIFSNGRIIAMYHNAGPTFTLFYDDSGPHARTISAPKEPKDPPASYLR